MTTLAEPAPLPRRAAPRRLRIPAYYLLLLPAAFVLGGLFGFPMLWLLQFSLSPSDVQPTLFATPTLTQYTRFLGDWFYIDRILLTTVRVSLLSCIIAIVIGYPVAFWIAQVQSSFVKAMLIAAVLCPLWLNTVIRVFGVMLLLFETGPVNGALNWLGLPSVQFLYNEIGVVIGLTYLAIPFFVIAMLGVIQQLDRQMIEAGYSLGAGPVYVFRRIIFPATLPGVIAGFILIFCISIASFAIPALLGGGKVPMLGVLIYREAMVSGNVAFASAMGFILLSATLLSLTVVSFVLHRIAGVR